MHAAFLYCALFMKANKIHTGWLDSRIAMRVRSTRPPWYVAVICGVLHRAVAKV